AQLCVERAAQFVIDSSRPKHQGQERSVNARSMRLAVVAPFAALSLAGAGDPVFAAEQLLVTLDYDVGAGAAGCPSAPDFRRAVGTQLGYEPFRENADR